jgi:hypothetical protein
MGSGCIDPHFLDLGTSWRWLVTFTPRPLYPRGKSHRYTLDRRLAGLQSQSGRSAEDKILDPTGTRTPNPRSSVASRYFLIIAEVTHFFFCTRNRLYQRFVQPFLALTTTVISLDRCNIRLGWVSRVAYCILLPVLLGVDISPRVWQVTILAMFSNLKKKYLQCVLAARIFDSGFCCVYSCSEKKIRAGFYLSDRTIPLSYMLFISSVSYLILIHVLSEFCQIRSTNLILFRR